jgi:hypothetical protein
MDMKEVEKMNVYEMEPNEIGEAVETGDTIVVTLRYEKRVLILSKKDMKVSGAKVESIKSNAVKKEKVKKQKDRKYLNVKEDAVLGKTLNSTIALHVYNRYGVRLWDNVMKEILNKISSATETTIDKRWINDTFKPVFTAFNIAYSSTKKNALMMFLKESGVISRTLGGNKKATYVIMHDAAKNIST